MGRMGRMGRMGTLWEMGSISVHSYICESDGSNS